MPLVSPTEATIGCTSRLIKQTDRKENIGHPFPSCRAYVVDSSMNIVPRGNPGELVVEGPLVGRGYHNLPEATAKAFKKWPNENCNAYRTGDLVRLMPDDTIEIMGRIDTQIKLRGVRIESEGVSNVLRKASKQPLDVSTLIAKHPDSGSELLVSFIAFGDRQVSVSERRSGRVELARDFPPSLMRSLKDMTIRELAVYMRPSHIIPLAFLPLSLNMKTDTKLLAHFFRSTPVSTLLEVQNERGPASTTEEQALDSNQSSVAKIVSRLSNTPIDAIRPDSNLFECGMDSIKLSSLAQELRGLWPMSRITVTDILAKPVIAEIAQLCHSSQPAISGTAGSACDEFDHQWRAAAENVFRPEDIEAVLPTFPVQDGVLFQALISPSQYIQHFAYLIEPHVTINDLRWAWSEVICSHPILRAAFIVEDTPLQVILKPGAVYVPINTHDQHTNVDRDSFGKWFKSCEMSRISVEINEDLTVPAFRINVYGTKDKFMVVSLSHAIYDGIAMPNLMADVDAVLKNHKSQRSEQLQPILDAIDVAQRGAQDFWVSKFNRVDLQPRIDRSTGSNAQHMRRTLSAVSYDVLQSACRSHRTTMQALGCASFALAGRNCFGWQEVALFGVIRSGRSLPVDQIETSVVPLVSVVPFLLNTDGKSPSDLLRDSQAELISTSPYENTPLGRIQRWVRAQSVFNVLFSCRIQERRDSYASFKHIQTDSPPPEFPLSIEMLADPHSNIVELRAVFTESVSIADMDDIVARLESSMEYFCKGSSSIGPLLDSSNAVAPARPSAVSANTSRYDVPDLALEKTLAEIVAPLLDVGHSSIGPTSSLVALGLTSLKAVALARKLKDSNIVISAVDIIQADNIQGISAQCTHRSTKSGNSDEGQQWLDALHQELKTELQADKLRLTAKDEPRLLCATALQAGMLSQRSPLRSRTIQATSILRTSFVFASDCGRWAQATHSDFEFPWSSKVFSSVPTALSEFISTLPFQETEDFARPPINLCHFTSGNDNYLLVVLHHALYDGMSLPLLFDRVRSAYHHMDFGPSTSFHELVPQILLQERYGTAYWTNRLRGVTPFTFPRIDAAGGAWRSSAMCDMELADIKRTCRRYQVNAQCLGQAAMAKVLSRISSQRDVVFGQVVSGRTLPGAENVIGPVFNTIPYRVEMSTCQTYGELLRKIQRSNNESLSHQHASLRIIQRELGVKSLVDALFLFQPDSSVESKLPPIWDSLENASRNETKAQYGLNIELYQTTTGFHIRASCRANAMDQARLSALLAEFSQELQAIVLHPTSSIFNDSISTITSPSGPREPQATPELNGPVGHPSKNSPQFVGWSSDQLKFKDIVVKFTKIPNSAIRPSSQLASLGIDSISAIQLAGIAKRAGIKLYATDVAGSNTLADVAEVIAKRSGSTKPESVDAHAATRPLLDKYVTDQALLALPPSIRDTVQDVIPTTPGMDFMLSSCNRSGGWRFQHVFAFEVSRGTDASKLRLAWDQLVQRHAILRSVFMNVEARNVLCVLKPEAIQAPWTTSIVKSNQKDLEEVGRHAQYLFTNPPQLRGGPAAAVIYVCGKESDYMILGMHHALYDAWSFNILIRDLENLYLGKHSTGGNDLAYLARAVSSPNSRNEQRAYWQTALDGFQPSMVENNLTQLPTAQRSSSRGKLRRQLQVPLILIFGALQALFIARRHISQRARKVATNLAVVVNAFVSLLALVRMLPPLLSLIPQTKSNTNTNAEGQSKRMYSISRDLVVGFSDLQTRAAEHNLPLHMVLLACWAKAQAKYSSCGNKNIVFGLIHSGRGLDGVEDIGAPSINILPVYVRDVLEGNAFVIAERLQADLKLRSPVIEQSRLQDVSSWVGAPGQPLFHYFVNLLRVPSSTEDDKPAARILKRIKVPVDSRSARTPEPEPGAFQMSSFPVMGEVLDDCMIEIFFDRKKDSIGMEVTCKACVMSEKQARELAETWSEEVRNIFS
ncbi:condensation domain protein [Ceratobasidium sp. AG-Ba]|nr:condensation domain protein [Ceratobasidium sp. AG-Ba]